MKPLITAREMREHQIQIHEPFSEFLQGEKDEFHFEISLLDVVHLAGHACPSMVGAFLISQRAVLELFPQDRICQRGDVSVHLSGLPDEGATGPSSNVFSLIFGAWAESGFGGLQGRFRRRGLLEYGASDVTKGKVKFRRISNGREIELGFDLSALNPPVEVQSDFQRRWRWMITEMLRNPKSVGL